jgi:tetratricopeptide (TPR) repeat protein
MLTVRALVLMLCALFAVPTHAQSLPCTALTAHLLAGGQAHGAGDYAKALYEYDCALTFAPDDPHILTARAQAQHALGNWQAALAGLDRAITAHPTHAGAYLARAEVAFSLRWYEFALKDAYDANALAPNDPHTYYWRGMAHLMLGEEENARLDLISALDLRYEPRDQLWQAFATLASSQGDHAKAIGYLENAIEVAPNHADYYRQVGDLHRKLNQPQDAVQAYQAYIALSNRADPIIVRYVETTHAQDGFMRQAPLALALVLGIALALRAGWQMWRAWRG